MTIPSHTLSKTRNRTDEWVFQNESQFAKAGLEIQLAKVAKEKNEMQSELLSIQMETSSYKDKASWSKPINLLFHIKVT